MKILIFLALLFVPMAASAQTVSAPPIGPGVSQELAKWRAARYSDVRYKLNLTLETMSPVLKGTIEVRVNVSPLPKGTVFGTGLVKIEPGEAPPQSMPPIILDWRKIKGHEDKSTISNVSINGRSATSENHPVAEAATPLLRKEGNQDLPLTYVEQNEHLIFRDGVEAGENVIKLDFTSPILTSGSAITRYVDKEDGAEYIYSLFVPSDASTAFPVFDQPDLKARFTVLPEVPPDWRFVSNLAWGCFDIDGTSRTDTPPKPEKFCLTDETKPISTYVFAFAAGPFAHISQGFRTPGIVVINDSEEKEIAVEHEYQERLKPKIYVRKSQVEKFKPHASEVFRLNREAIKYFEEYFDYKFPFPKYDLVLIPEFPFGGMEHAGATFLRESSIIFPQEPTKNDHISRAVLIFHEAAHQWFGDTVTMRWFDDLWLKEGFANFAAYKAMERIMPEMNAWKVFYERVKQAAYQTDSTKGTTPIYQEIPNLSAAKSAYGNIVYNKAPAFLRQAEFYLGEDKFQTAVRAFLKKHEFGNAGWEDLVKEFEAASGIELRDWAKRWVAQPGLPTFKVIRSGFGLKSGVGSAAFAPKPGGDWSENFDALVIFSDRSKRVLNVAAKTSLKPTSYNIAPAATASSAEIAAILPNYGDYGYGIFLLDEKSREYVLKNIQNEKDPFLRTMMWGALWDSVREGELDPRIYVDLVSKQVAAESDETIISSVLGRASTALNYYVSDESREDVLPQFENALIERLTRVESLGQRITLYRAFLNVAGTAEGRGVLRAMLKASNESTRVAPKPFPPGLYSSEDIERILRFDGMLRKLPLKTKDKFDIVTRLLILNDPEAPKLLAELEKTETSDDAKRYAYAARAGIATAENKAKYWNDFVNNKEISESWIEAAFGPFNSVRHTDLTLPYLKMALQELPNHKRSRKIFFVNGWLGAFIGGQRSEEALNIVNKFLADNPNLDRDLRLKVLENADVIERAVRIRKMF